MAKVTVGCKLPHGIILQHPLDPKTKVTLNGVNKAIIKGANYATTEVDEDFWDQWFAVNKDFPAVKSKAIFVAKNAYNAVEVADDLKKEKTGFEPMQPNSHGIKTVDKKD